MMRTIVLASGLATCLLISAGPISAAIVYTGAAINENFDSLTGASNHFSATVGTQAAVTGTSGWEGTRLGGSGTTMNLTAAASGSASGGAIYAFGPTTPAEKSLGILTSAQHTPGMGVEIVNQSGFALTSASISFTQESWRLSGVGETPATDGVVNVIAASWSRTGLATSATYLSAATGFTPVTDLDLVSPAPNNPNGAAAIDGNLPANQALRSTTIVFQTPLANGESFFLRFQDVNDPGADAAMAIDDFQFTAVPEPSSMILSLVALTCGLLVRRRYSA